MNTAAVEREHPGRTAAVVLVSAFVLVALVVGVGWAAAAVLDMATWTFAG